ncbi:hypothetical protein Kisp01_61940 [Kineosporia sp. NBRC 101677]|uniref:DUF2510 domain-containing protein n=1 Tax=Kineosporia sp. NBRC 101677 TaxID=3032197 RepID=UPI0024A1161B|nr:DUF2510 domain-containing protein [Kineosporia sp. NBRC 101677]GLY19180.1 hypothetical protein Kisp01_61940 [Kineosporia sp. NBRC 101677]
MKSKGWHEARLIPTTGIASQVEQERRASAALLATMSAHPRFGRALTGPLGAPEGVIETFVEVPFSSGPTQCLPHGVVRVREGGRQWTALVEVSTGPRPLRRARLEAYLDLATEQGIDALLTISNEIPPVAGQHPTSVAKEKLGQVALLHYPWSKIVAEAVVEREEGAAGEPAAVWVLGELIHYLEHPRSGALLFEIADDAPTTKLPRLSELQVLDELGDIEGLDELEAVDNVRDPVAEVPAPRGPARREIRIALRDDVEPEPPGKPGWYREQGEFSGRLRWWDGEVWTDHVYALPPAPPGVENRPSAEEQTSAENQRS